MAGEATAGKPDGESPARGSLHQVQAAPRTGSGEGEGRHERLRLYVTHVPPRKLKWRFWRGSIHISVENDGRREKSSFSKSTETLRGWWLSVVGMD